MVGKYITNLPRPNFPITRTNLPRPNFSTTSGNACSTIDLKKPHSACERASAYDTAFEVSLSFDSGRSL